MDFINGKLASMELANIIFPPMSDPALFLGAIELD
jgi:hypothetical protein